MATSPKHYCVVGGGMLGMALALDLADRGERVTLVERADHLGGLADGWRVGDVTWDRFYHVTLMSDSHTRKLLERVGLGDALEWRETRTGFYSGKRLHSMSNTLEFLQFEPLSLIDKLRLGFTIFYCARIRNWKRLENISVADWLSRWSGRRTFQKMWLPLLKSKLGDNYERTSAAFIWATINRMYAARRSGLKKEMFGYVRGGYAAVNRALASALEESGVEVLTGAEVQSVQTEGSGQRVDFAGSGQSVVADEVVMTVPAALTARVCPELSDSERQRLLNVDYMGVVCASVLLRKPLGGYYVTNITDDGFPYTGVIEMTALVDREEVGGHHLVYLPKYVPSDDPLLKATDAEIEASFLGGLKRMYPELTDADIVSFQVARVSHVMALPTLAYSEKAPPRETSRPGLSVVNSAQIVNGTLNVNETVALASAAAQALSADAESNTRELKETANDGRSHAREFIAGSR